MNIFLLIVGIAICVICVLPYILLLLDHTAVSTWIFNDIVIGSTGWLSKAWSVVGKCAVWMEFNYFGWLDVVDSVARKTFGKSVKGVIVHLANGYRHKQSRVEVDIDANNNVFAGHYSNDSQIAVTPHKHHVHIVFNHGRGSAINHIDVVEKAKNFLKIECSFLIVTDVWTLEIPGVGVSKGERPCTPSKMGTAFLSLLEKIDRIDSSAKVLVIGESLGSYMSLLACNGVIESTHFNKVRGILLLAAFDNVPAAIDSHFLGRIFLVKWWLSPVLRRSNTLPSGNDMIQQQLLINQDLTIILLHGQEDYIIPIDIAPKNVRHERFIFVTRIGEGHELMQFVDGPLLDSFFVVSAFSLH